MNYKVFIVSIERNKKRNQVVKDELTEQGFKPEIFYGVDYKEQRLPNNIISSWGFLTPKSVLACAASHILLWQHVSKLDIDFALIVEDDSIVIKKEFDNYLKDFKPYINDNTFLNLSTSLSIDKKNDGLFSDSHIVLALDTYILTPALAKKLFDFYKTHGLSYHIDLHLTFIKDQVGFNIVHFNKKITRGSQRYESSMIDGHEKVFILKLLKDTETYKELNTPIIEVSGTVLTAYRIIVFFLFLIILTFTYLFPSSFVYLAVLWFFLGLCVYDL